MPPKPHLNPPKRNKIDPESEPSLIPNFPNELIIEILARLPAKSLLKFRSVSKSWLSLISNPRFIKTHLAIASGRDDYGRHALIFTVHPQDGDSHFHHELCSVNSLLYAPEAEIPHEAIDIGHQMKCPGKSFVFVGSCSGLVCIYNFLKQELFLWNPCLKKFKKLPDTGIGKKHHYFETFGFGYDELNDDYKVVGLFRFLNGSVSSLSEGSGGTDDTGIKIYSLKKNSWSEKEDFNIGIPRVVHWSEYLMYASGKLHWPVSDPIDGRRGKIGSLDLASQTYEEMDFPADSESNSHCFEIGVLGGCLSVFYKADVWIMKDYGVKDSWTKLMTIPYFDQPGEVDYHGRCRLVCLLNDGKILFVSSSVLLVYNSKRNTFRRFPHIGPLGNVIMYVESLVLPHAADVQ